MPAALGGGFWRSPLFQMFAEKLKEEMDGSEVVCSSLKVGLTRSTQLGAFVGFDVFGFFLLCENWEGERR
jgi:hypothetical protein